MAKPLTKKQILEMLQVAEDQAFTRLRRARRQADGGDWSAERVARLQEAWLTCDRLYKTAMGLDLIGHDPSRLMIERDKQTETNKQHGEIK